jgi:hypothetical protein
MTIILSKLISDGLDYFPRIIFCDDMKLSGNDGIGIPYLDNFYDLLDEKIMIMKGTLKINFAMSWCINSAFSQKALHIYKQNGSCDFVHQKDLDVTYIIDRFKEHMKESSWKEFLKKENVEIVYDIENCKIDGCPIPTVCPVPPSH